MGVGGRCQGSVAVPYEGQRLPRHRWLARRLAGLWEVYVRLWMRSALLMRMRMRMPMLMFILILI
jgi:hypothetical protein